eukprot:2291697-Rhodomonas_salina.1
MRVHREPDYEAVPLYAYANASACILGPGQAAISLRLCYAMSGIGIAYVGIGLRPCLAMSGTEKCVHSMVASAYAVSGTAIPCPELGAEIAYGGIGLQPCYAESGT